MFLLLELYLECVFVIKNKKKAMENKIWRCSSDGKENIVDRLILESGVMRSVALYLASRGITPETLGRYLNATFADLSDPFRFAGIEIAVQRLWQAIRNRERILIHGDYDTDGITATALDGNFYAGKSERIAQIRKGRIQIAAQRLRSNAS